MPTGLWDMMSHAEIFEVLRAAGCVQGEVRVGSPQQWIPSIWHRPAARHRAAGVPVGCARGG